VKCEGGRPEQDFPIRPRHHVTLFVGVSAGVSLLLRLGLNAPCTVTFRDTAHAHSATGQCSRTPLRSHMTCDSPHRSALIRVDMNHLCCGTTPRQYLSWRAVEGQCYGSRIYTYIPLRRATHSSLSERYQQTCFPSLPSFLSQLLLSKVRFCSERRATKSSTFYPKASSLTLRNIHNALPARDLSSDIPPQVCVCLCCVFLPLHFLS
jgi:hypothetical protein